MLRIGHFPFNHISNYYLFVDFFSMESDDIIITICNVFLQFIFWIISKLIRGIDQLSRSCWSDLALSMITSIPMVSKGYDQYLQRIPAKKNCNMFEKESDRYGALME